MITVRAPKSSYRAMKTSFSFGNQSFRAVGADVLLFEDLSMSLDEDHLEYWEAGFKPLNWKHVRHQKAKGVYLHDFGNQVVSTDPSDPSTTIGLYHTSGIVRGSDGVWVLPTGQSWMYRCTGRTLFYWGFYVHPNTGRVQGVYQRFASEKYKGRIVYNSTNASGTTLTGWSNALKAAGYNYRTLSLGDCVSVVLAAGSGFLDGRAYGNYSYKTQTFSRPTKPLSERDLRAKIRHEQAIVRSEANRHLTAARPELHASAFDSINKFDGNMLAFCSELSEFGTSSIRSIVDLMRSEGRASDLASFWLSNRYGDRLSFSDAADLVRAIDRNFLTVSPRTTRYVMGKSRSTASSSLGGLDVTSSLSVQLAVTPNDSNALMRMVRHAYEWDYYPSLGNVWDMIPMSFVVDWFINVGEIYESVDRMVQSRYYTVAAILESVKAESHSVLLPGVTYSYYCRRIRHSLQLGVASVELGLPSAVNVIDGISLIMS